MLENEKQVKQVILIFKELFLEFNLKKQKVYFICSYKHINNQITRHLILVFLSYKNNL